MASTHWISTRNSGKYWSVEGQKTLHLAVFRCNPKDALLTDCSLCRSDMIAEQVSIVPLCMYHDCKQFFGLDPTLLLILSRQEKMKVEPKGFLVDYQEKI